MHLVWPNPLTNRLSEVQLHPSFWRRGRTLPCANGSGPALGAVGVVAALMVEATHSMANNAGLTPTTMLSSVAIASFNDSTNFGAAGATLGQARAAPAHRVRPEAATRAAPLQANGRAFLLGGDGLFDVRPRSRAHAPSM